MSAKEALKALRIHNAQNAVSRANNDLQQRYVYVAYIGDKQFQVILPGGQTDPDGPWYDNGHKTFSLSYGDGDNRKTLALERAQKWAAEKYGVESWERIPGLRESWFPKPVADHIKSLMKAVV